MSSGSEEWRSLKALSVRSASKGISLFKKEIHRPSFTKERDENALLITQEHDQLVSRQNEQDLAAATTQYTYEKLPPNDGIRVLELLPGSAGELIKCRLLVTNLSQSVRNYEALSYVWGHPEQARETIIVDGARMEIYETLYNILVRLRSPTASRSLWVDALCINQSNIDERNIQVPLMQSIYKDASRTVVWLGPEKSSTGDTFQMIHELAEEARRLYPPPPLPPKANSSTEDSRTPQRPALITTPPSFHSYIPVNPIPSKVRDRWDGDFSIFNVISCMWWQRAWTVQELLLSSNIVLLKGSYEIEWTELCTAVDHGLNLSIWPIVDSGFVLNQAIVPYASIRALERRLRQQTSDGIISGEIFMSLLVHCRHRDARDPRDKIYAVLGLIRDSYLATQMATADENPVSMTLKPDYGNPVVYIYRQISQILIKQTGSLDVLGVCPMSSRRGLPSWVTDWSIKTTISSPLMYDSIDHPRTTHASKHTRANPKFPADGVTIILNGHELTTVLELSDILRHIPFNNGLEEAPPSPLSEEIGFRETMRGVWDDVHQGLHLMAAYFKTLFLWEKFAATKQPSNPGDVSTSIYWQTLCTGTYVQGNKTLTEQSYKDWLQTLEPVRKAEKTLKGFASKITPPLYTMNPSSWKGFSEFARYIEGAHERRLAWTANGWLCLLPEAAKRGDRILLAEGGRVPLVMRPDGDGYNMFIGEAYVHGIMDGEAFLVESCHEIKIC